jgi:hypothetical protein
VNRATNAWQNMDEPISIMQLLLWHFLGQQDRELPGAMSRGLLDRPSGFKVHRLGHGLA